MRIVIEPTTDVIELGGVKCRRWIGTTPDNRTVDVLVRAIGTADEQTQAALDAAGCLDVSADVKPLAILNTVDAERLSTVPIAQKAVAKLRDFLAVLPAEMLVMFVHSLLGMLAKTTPRHVRAEAAKRDDSEGQIFALMETIERAALSELVAQYGTKWAQSPPVVDPAHPQAKCVMCGTPVAINPTVVATYEPTAYVCLRCSPDVAFSHLPGVDVERRTHRFGISPAKTRKDSRCLY